jgi:hypothetical protein
MSKLFNFGEEFEYSFFVRDGQGGFENLHAVTNNPSIHIFDAIPSRTDARTGAGALQTITSWSNSASNGGKDITISAIADPNETDAKERYEYYIAINYRLETDGDILTDIRLLPMVRPHATHSPVSTVGNDLKKIYSTVDEISSSTDQSNKIQQAKNDIETILESKGFEWSEIWETSILNDAISYYALHLIMLDNMRETNDAYASRAALYEKTASNKIESLKIKIKKHQDALPSEPEQIGTYILVKR